MRKTPEEYGMEQKGILHFPFKLISKSNHKSLRWNYLPPKFRAFEDKGATISRLYLRQPKYPRGWVVIRAEFKSKVRIDPTNSFKGVCDFLVKGNVFSDDKEVYGTVIPFEDGPLDRFAVEIWA